MRGDKDIEHFQFQNMIQSRVISKARPQKVQKKSQLEPNSKSSYSYSISGENTLSHSWKPYQEESSRYIYLSNYLKVLKEQIFFLRKQNQNTKQDCEQYLANFELILELAIQNIKSYIQQKIVQILNVLREPFLKNLSEKQAQLKKIRQKVEQNKLKQIFLEKKVVQIAQQNQILKKININLAKKLELTEKVMKMSLDNEENTNSILSMCQYDKNMKIMQKLQETIKSQRKITKNNDIQQLELIRLKIKEKKKKISQYYDL